MKVKITYAQVKEALAKGFISPLNSIKKVCIIALAKSCAKNHGVKGFRKLRLKREVYSIGKQGVWINKFIAVRLIKSIESLGLTVEQKGCTMQLAEKGMMDTMTITR